MSARSFQQAILKFYREHGRKDLPWQQNKTHYRVWISEIMLQQTQVTTVIPYYERFMQRFADLQSLAAADVDEVLALWTGLGYYTRARNLHKCARVLVNEYNGIWPDSQDAIAELPGIGPSTAGAIHSLVTGKPATLLDGNVKRVLARYFGIKGWPGQKPIHDKLWQLAEQLTPNKQVDHYNQAMMDLGATLCKRSKPLCDVCPISKSCIAKQQNRQLELPSKKPKKTKPVKATQFLIFKHQNSVLLEKRSSSGIWGGLWSLPEQEDKESEMVDLSEPFRTLASKVKPKAVKPFRHTFSHYHLDIKPLLYQIDKKPRLVMDDERLEWQDLNQLEQLGLPSPVLKLLRKL